MHKRRGRCLGPFDLDLYIGSVALQYVTLLFSGEMNIGLASPIGSKASVDNIYVIMSLHTAL